MGLSPSKIMRILVLLLAICAVSFSQQADLIVINANVYTSAKTPRAEAFAITNGKITNVGTTAEIRKLASDKTQTIDLHGAFVMPGINDAHVHLANAGFEKLNVNLVGTKSLAEMQSRIAERVKQSKPGEWIQGRGWDHTKWDKKETPTRVDIDKVTGEHPAFFTRVDGHILIANSAALKAAGITKDTKDPVGGKIDRDSSGEPTGIIRETAMSLVYEKVPPPTKELRRKALEVALADAAQWGVTSAQDNSSWEDFLVYEELEKQGTLTLRVSEWLPFDAPVDELEKMRAHHDQHDPMLHTGMLKGFMDGSLGSRTAALLAAYSDDHSNAGIPRYTQEQLDDLVGYRAQRGFQMGFHAIGDRGSEMALDAFQTYTRSLRATPPDALIPSLKRPRIEHDQVIAPDQFMKYVNLGVIASVQPNHLLTDMNWAEERIGPKRAKTSYPWKQFLDTGVPLAFGTDYPVEPITPFRGIYAAITRKNEEGTKSYYPEQKLTIDQAIAAYTIGSAYAEFAEKQKGTLAPGMLADFIVLDRDITKVDPAEILKAQVLRTVVGGKTVYEKQ
jgi:hypothetical protein